MLVRNIISGMFIFFVFCNIFAAISIYKSGELESSYPGYNVKDIDNILYSLCLVLFFYLITFSIFHFFSKVKNSITIEPECISNSSSKNAALIVFILQLCYVYAIVFEGAGVAGGVENNNQTLLSSFFAIFRVDDFVFMYFSVFHSFLLINFIVFFVSFILRGWLSVFISGFIIVLIRFGERLSKFKILFIFIFALLAIAAMPFMLEVRNFYRITGEFDFVRAMVLLDKFDLNLFDILIKGFESILMRFQQVESLIYLIENFEKFSRLYDKGYITPIYFDGPLISYLFNLFNDSKSAPLGFHLADQSRTLIEGRKTAMSPGIISYCLLDYFSFLYAFIVPALLGYVTTFIRSYGFKIAISYFFFIYFSFGWSNAIIGVFFTVALFLFLINFSRFVYKNDKR